jgi:tRNA_anti-like
MSIPLPLKIVAIVLVVLVILLFVVIKKKEKGFIRPVIILIILGIGFGVWQGLREYNRTNEDLSHVKADIKISAVDLIHEYEANDSASDQKYLGKVVEMDGNIKKIEKDEKGYYTVVVGDTTTLSSVRCSMDTIHNEDAAHLTAGSSATVRGKCTGFNKNEMGLGSDVILNFGVIVRDKK